MPKISNFWKVAMWKLRIMFRDYFDSNFKKIHAKTKPNYYKHKKQFFSVF